MKRIIIHAIGLSVFIIAPDAFLFAQSTDYATTPTVGGKLWGEIMGDYAYVGHGDSAGRGNGTVQYKGLGSGAHPVKGQNAFEIRRIYLGYNYYINNKFSAGVLLDYNGNADVNGDRTVFIKQAYLAWKNIFEGSDLIIGQQTTNSFADSPYETERLYGYRSIERTIIDMRKVDASADMGIKLTGRIWRSKPEDSTKVPTLLGYSFMIGDNSGLLPVPGFGTSGATLNSTTDVAKRFRENIYLNTWNGALTIGAYTDFLNYGGETFGDTQKKYQNAFYTLKGYAVYKHKWFGIGFEWFEQALLNGEFEVYKPGTGTNDTVNAVQSGISIFGYGVIIKDKLKVFARYDNYNPDTHYSFNNNETFTSKLVSANTYKETFISVGLDWAPTADKRVHIMPNIWYDGINNGKGSDALKSDNYMVYRLTFYATLDGRKVW